MKLLLLYGVNCTNALWDGIGPFLSRHEADLAAYPHEVTQKAENIGQLTSWVYDTYGGNSYDAVIGHSMGGLIALQLAAQYKMSFKHIIYLDTNLRPAGPLYRNLMTEEHMALYGKAVSAMLSAERPFYTPRLLASLQEDFDYTGLLREAGCPVHALYGDRDRPEDPRRIRDLMLSPETLEGLDITFIPHSCHMIPLENPQGLRAALEQIL